MKSSTAHLFARHPEIANSLEFRAWSHIHPASLWHESPSSDEAEMDVYVQADDESSVFVSSVHRNTEASVSDGLRWWLKRARSINVPAEEKRSHVIADFLAVALGDRIHAIRPYLTDSQIGWEVEIFVESGVSRYRVFRGVRSEPERIEKLHTGEKADRLSSENDDSLATNEIHHGPDWTSLVTGWISGAASVRDKAFRIWINAISRMIYDATIAEIEQFIFSDRLTINTDHWRGICGEWAVVQVSLLRSIGIPAVLKWLSFTDAGKAVGHACLEFYDGTRWVHMDALWQAFDRPSVYRDSGMTDVLVMDACCPPPSGNGMCDAYRDFTVSPPYPGLPRTGYSFAGAVFRSYRRARGIERALDVGNKIAVTNVYLAYCSGSCFGTNNSINTSNWTSIPFLFVDHPPIALVIELQVDATILSQICTLAIEVRDIKTGKPIYQDSSVTTLSYTAQDNWIAYSSIPVPLASLAPGDYNIHVAALVGGIFNEGNWTINAGPYVYPMTQTLIVGKWTGQTGNPFNPLTIQAEFSVVGGSLQGKVTGAVNGTISNVFVRSDGYFSCTSGILGQNATFEGEIDLSNPVISCGGEAYLYLTKEPGGAEKA